MSRIIDSLASQWPRYSFCLLMIIVGLPEISVERLLILMWHVSYPLIYAVIALAFVHEVLFLIGIVNSLYRASLLAKFDAPEKKHHSNWRKFLVIGLSMAVGAYVIVAEISVTSLGFATFTAIGLGVLIIIHGLLFVAGLAQTVCLFIKL